MQSQVELMRINLKFEAPVIQVGPTNNYLHYLSEARMRATSAWGQVDGHACLKAMCFYWETGLPV